MKQFQIEYSTLEMFTKNLTTFKDWCHSNKISKMMFQIYSEILEPDPINAICKTIEQIFPDAPYMGCSTSGNIVNCQLSSSVTIICTIFELPQSQFKIFQYDLSKQSVDTITKQIVEETKANIWVKAIEMYFTIPETSTTRFCDGMKDIAPDIQIFGGVSCSNDITSDASCVFSKIGGFSDKSIIILFYGGEDFYVESIKVTGWKPLGRKFHVTKSNGSILQELDGIPAYDVYNKYLNIKNDENFFYNTLEFPLFYEHNNTTILRTPVASNADGSITMSSDIDVGSVVRISYGDPATIIENIEEDSKKIYTFQPDLLHIFSCAARRTFWTSQEPTYELMPFKEMSPSVGFFSHGEFLRTTGDLNQHNVTLVIAAMREGVKKPCVAAPAVTNTHQLSKVPLVSRLATFISVTSLELENINNQLEQVNDKLKVASIIDGLTGLYNRKEIQTQIERELSNVKQERFSIIMLDIDNFKQVNDTYGHQQGDAVIIALAKILHNERTLLNNRTLFSEKFSAGRWGGEEFMLLMRDTDFSSAAFAAELIRQCFANTNFPNVRPQTISIGVTQAKEDDTIDTLCSRVDDALYQAKKGGKNRVVVV